VPRKPKTPSSSRLLGKSSGYAVDIFVDDAYLAVTASLLSRRIIISGILLGRDEKDLFEKNSFVECYA